MSTITVSINLDSFSDDLCPEVKQAISNSGVKRIEKKFEFFAQTTCNPTNLTSDSPRILKFITELETWLLDYFDSFVTPEQIQTVVEEAVTEILYTSPANPVGSKKFKILCYAYATAKIIKLCFSESIESSRRKGDAKAEFYDMTKKTLADLVDLKNLEEQDMKDLLKKVLNMEIVHEQSTEFLRVSANSFLEIFDMAKDHGHGDITTKKAGATILALSGIRIATDSVDEEFTCFRGLKSGLTLHMTVVSLLDGLNISEWFEEDSNLAEWNELANKTAEIMNLRLFRFQNDIVNGNNNSAILQKVAKGATLEKALDEEIENLKHCLTDYGRQYKLLAKKYEQGNDALLKYMEYVDSWLYGSLKLFNISPKYGMKNQIKITNNL